jgi:hypothetical protein
MSLELKTHLDEQDPKLFSNKEEKLLNPSARVQNLLGTVHQLIASCYRTQAPDSRARPA